MQFINHMYQSTSDYLRRVPQNTGRQIICAFGAATILRTVITSDLRLGLMAGALSIIATLVHGLVTPLFQLLMGRRYLSWDEEMCRTCVAIITTAYIAAAFGNVSLVNELFIQAMVYGFINFMDENRKDLRLTNFIFLVPSHNQSIFPLLR